MSLPIPASGLYYPSKIGHIYLEAIDKLIGVSATHDLLRSIGLRQYIGAYPADNFDRAFDFADFSSITAGLEQVQAQRNCQPALTAEAGRLCFDGGMKAFGGLASFGRVSLGFQSLPQALKIKTGLLAMSTVFTTLSDQHTEVKEHADHYDYILHKCPMCWGRHADKPICDGAGAMLVEGLYWVTERRFSVIETSCCAMGDAACTFAIRKMPLDINV